MKKLYFLTSCVIALTLIGGLPSIFSNSANAQITVFPWTEDFGSSGCGLPTGFVNTGSDPWDFQNTSETYMEGLDHTSNGGCFASMDDSGGASDDSCLLTSPLFDLSALQSAQLRFWWQNSNSTTSTPSTTGPRPWSNLYVDVSTNSGVSWTRNIWQVEDSQQVGWAEAIVDLTPYIGATTVFRIRGLETRSFRSDMSLDDLKLFEPQPFDAAVTQRIAPVAGICGNTNQDITIEVANEGFDTITSVDLSYQINNLTPVTQTVNMTILPTAKYVHTFSQKADLSQGGKYNVKVWAALVGDNTPSNDTIEDSVTVAPVITTYPYLEDFESDDGGWTISGTNPSWAWGSPAKGTINSAASGSNAWVTGGLGNGFYNSNEDSHISGPCFDFSQVEGDPWVVFDIYWHSEFSWDGGVLQSSTDEGQTWKNVGDYQDPFNWYNDNTIAGDPGGQPIGWTGGGFSTGNGSNGWVQAKHQLDPSLVGVPNLRLRFAFGADGVFEDDGMAIDNFTVVDYREVDLGPQTISLCGGNAVELNPESTNGTAMWSTGDSTGTITVNQTGKYWVEYTDTILGLTSSDTIDIIQSPAPVIAFDKPVDTVALDASIILDPKLPFDLEYLWTPGDFDFPYLLARGGDLGVGSHTFNLKVSDSLLCEDEDNITVVVIDFTGIAAFDGGEISIYPNPVHDVLTISTSQLNSDQTYARILDAGGKLVLSENIGAISGERQFEIDVSTLPSGFYLLHFQMDDQVVINKLIIE